MSLPADLLQQWDLFEPQLSAATAVCVLTDYDGTLVPLAGRPEEALLPSRVRNLLESLSRHPSAKVGIVSGRSLPDLLCRVNLDRLWYVGNHGFEIRTPAGETRRAYSAQEARFIDLVGDHLTREIGLVPGLILERKGPIVAVHYRNVELPRVGHVQRAVLRVLHRHQDRVALSPGNLVLEIRLRGTRHKGLAVREIRRTLPRDCLVIYFGDDRTDRDVFHELRRTGISVEVGPAIRSGADFSLEGSSAVREALRRIEWLLRRRKRR